MEDNKYIDVEVTIEGQALSRRYWMTDGVLKSDMKVAIQEMVDAVLEKKGDIFDHDKKHKKSCSCDDCNRYLSNK